MRLFIFIFFVLRAIGPAEACSTVEGYKVPTNFELVQKAQVIVLARVKQVPTDLEASMMRAEQWVTLEPVQFLKGSVPADQLRLMGWQRPGPSADGIPTPTTLSQSHWSAGLGACIRQFYQPGELVVALFERDEKFRRIAGTDFMQIADPFARSVETVDGPDDVWVRAVERYVALQSGPPENLDERIRASIVQLREADTPESQAIAADLEYQLTRSDPSDVWMTFSTPFSSSARAHKQGGAVLYCLAGTPPGVLVDRASRTKVELVAGGVSFAAHPVSPSPGEKLMLDPPLSRLATEPPPKPKFLNRFADAGRLTAMLRNAGGSVEIRVDGKTLVSGQPLDALLRWARHCDKLQALPAPTEDSFGPG